MVKAAPPIISVSTSVSPARRSSKWWEQCEISLREISFLSVRQKVPVFFLPLSVRLLEKFQFLEILCFSSPPAQGGGNVSVSLEYLPSSEDSYRLASNIVLLCMYQQLSTISNRCCRNQMSPLRERVGPLKWGHKQTDRAWLSSTMITLNKTAVISFPTLTPTEQRN